MHNPGGCAFSLCAAYLAWIITILFGYNFEKKLYNSVFFPVLK